MNIKRFTSVSRVRIIALLLFVVAVGIVWLRKESGLGNAFAASGGFPSEQYLTAPVEGMSQYAVNIQQASSLSATLQAVGDWNSYISSRSQWGIGLTTALIDRLATADWNAKQAGAPTITSQQLTDALASLANAKLNTMTAAQQEALFEQMVYEETPKVTLALNDNYGDATAVQGGDGKWTVAILPDPFDRRKAFFQTNSPGMVSSFANFYPGEAMVVFYSVVAGDRGYGGVYPSETRELLTKLTGMDMTNEMLFGANGYLVRRPLDTFLTEQAMSQLFSDLGF